MSKEKVNWSPIPDKVYFSIGEASELTGAKPHVLRYWEEEFPQLKPTTRSGQRRYYQQKDILLLRKIRELLYDKGFTVMGAKKHLQQNSAEVKQEISDKILENKENLLLKQPFIEPIISDNKNQSIIPHIISELELLLDECS